MGGPVFNIVFNSLSYLIMYFCFKLRSKYLWSPVPRRSYLQQVAMVIFSDELRARLGFGGCGLSWYLFVSGGVEFLLKGLLCNFAKHVRTRRQPQGGVSRLNNSFHSAWPECANLSTCYSSQSVSRRLCLRYAESSKGIAFISFTSWFKPCCFL